MDEKNTRTNIKGGAANLYYKDVASALAQYGNKGNLLIRVSGGVGHVAIIPEVVSQDAKPDNDILIAANRYDADGNIRYIVRYEKLREWCEYHSYICGLQHVYYIIKPIIVLGIYLGSRLVEIKKEPINDLSIFAERVKGFLDYPYVNDVEFSFAKWYAPDRFTCTTLAWYCAKSLYDIDISAGPLTSCISPLEVLGNIHVYTIYKIK